MTRPGTKAWRIGPRAGNPLRCIIMRTLPGGMIAVRASTFSRNDLTVRAEDVFADLAACREEARRRHAKARVPA